MTSTGSRERVPQSESGTPASDVLVAGPIHVDRGERRVTIDGVSLDLTPTEFKLLVMLTERCGRMQSRSDLLATVWDAAPDIRTRTVDMHVRRLRCKLGAAGELIETVRGFGYRLRTVPARLPRTQKAS